MGLDAEPMQPVSVEGSSRTNWIFRYLRELLAPAFAGLQTQLQLAGELARRHGFVLQQTVEQCLGTRLVPRACSSNDCA